LQVTEIIEFPDKGACVCLSDSLLLERGILLGAETRNLQDFDVIHVMDWSVESNFMWEGVIWRGEVIVCREWQRIGKGGVRFGEPIGRLKRGRSRRRNGTSQKSNGSDDSDDEST